MTNRSRYEEKMEATHVRDSFGTHEIGKEPADYIAPPPDAKPVARPARHSPGWYAAKHTTDNGVSAHVGIYWDGQQWTDPDMKIFSGNVLCDPSQTYANGTEALEASQKFFGELE